MEAAAVLQVEELTSGASGRIIPVFRNLRRLSPASPSPPSSPKTAPPSIRRRKFGIRRDEDDTMRRRDLAEAVEMMTEDSSGCQCTTSLFFSVRRNALFCRPWFLVSREINVEDPVVQWFLTVDWLAISRRLVDDLTTRGHGGSDGLHGYVPSLDHAVADTAAILEKVKLENPGVPRFLFGHSTGGAVVLKAASYPHIDVMLEGVILTSPALRVKPAHPIVGILYTGPIRVRTGHEILCISSYLMGNIQCITVPFFVLHGTADRVTDPLASQDLYNVAPSK
ncbi:hypothetical protein OROGR_005920 [Orobanche gracilis]